MWCSRALGYFIVCLRCLVLMLFVVFQSTWSFYCLHSMLDFDAICRGRKHFWKSLFAFDAWFWCYLWCSRALGHFIVCIGCLFLMLFVVAGTTFRSHCFSSMLDLDAICRGRTPIWRSLLFLDAWLWCYLSWPEALLDFIVCLRCLTLSVYVVFQNTWLFYCLPSMLDCDAICRGRTHFWNPLLVFDACFWWYLSWPEVLLKIIVCLRCLFLMLYVVFQSIWPFYCLHWMFVFDAICRGRRYF